MAAPLAALTVGATERREAAPSLAQHVDSAGTRAAAAQPVRDAVAAHKAVDAAAPAATAIRAALQDHRADRDDPRKREIDTIIAAKATGVTPGYIESLRRAAPRLHIDLDDATGARAIGLTPEFVAAMMSTGLHIASFDDLIGARAVGVDPGYIRGIVSAGYRGDLDDYIALAGMGVTADDVRRLKRAGMAVDVDTLALTKHGGRRGRTPDPDQDPDPDPDN